MAASATIHVVDDDEITRETLSVLLQAKGYDVALYESGRAFMDARPTATPACVVLDMHMPQLSGLDVLRQLKSSDFTLPIIMLTGRGHIDLAVQAMKLGAADFVSKPYKPETLLASVAESLAALPADGGGAAAAQEKVGRLSKREYEVVQGMIAGLPNKLIAHRLDLSPRTVEAYRATLMEKLEVRGLSSVVQLALAAGVQPLA
ncbi:response regulator transcription factor [Caulobacter sp. NIBR2454]|uniref:response regulator transcription factor n=1 Tax=Caulobacter sp. NIBR2454 TaxID=3015996 RepID=UPI0022B69EA8|nr:response regulator [Caulobacter sp. NIBR2454]